MIFVTLLVFLRSAGAETHGVREPRAPAMQRQPNQAQNHGVAIAPSSADKDPDSTSDNIRDVTADVPAIQNALQHILDRIVAAARITHPRAIKNVNWRIRITASPEINASVQIRDRDRSTGSSGVNHVDQVEVTAGLINLFMAEARAHPDGPQFNDALEEIAGIIAHELGHSIDFSQDPHAYGQLREVRADGIAIPLLHAAGIPTNSLNRAFRRIASVAGAVTESDLVRAVKSYVSTHPTDVFRTIQGEIGIVVSQMTQGGPQLRPLNVQRENFLAEIPHLPTLTPAQAQAAAEIATFPRPTSLVATISEIRATLNTLENARYSDAENRNLVFDRAARQLRHLMTLFDSQLAARGNHVPPNEREEVFSLLRQFETISIDSPLLATEKISIANDTRLETIPFFQSPEYTQFLRQTLTPRFESAARDLDTSMTWDSISLGLIGNSFCPPQFFAQLIADTLPQVQSRYPSTELSGVLAANFLARFSNSTQTLDWTMIMGRLYQQIADSLSESERNHFVVRFNEVARDPSSVGLRFQRSGSGERSGLDDQKLSYARAHNQWGDVESTARSIWRDRGFYAAFDFANNTNYTIDWHLICQIMGISAEVGRQQINESLRDFLRSNRYPQLLEALANGRPPLTKELALGTRYSSWFDANLGDDITDKNNLTSPTARFSMTRNRLQRRYILGHSEAFRNRYREVVRSRLRGLTEWTNEPPTAAKVRDAFLATMTEMLGDHHQYPTAVYDLQIESINELNLQPATKQRLISELYLEEAAPIPGKKASKDARGRSVDNLAWPNLPQGHPDEMIQWALFTKGEHNVRIYRALHKAGVVRRPTDILPLAQARMTETRDLFGGTAPRGRADKYTTRSHFEVVHAMAPLLSQELREVRSPVEFFQFIERVYDPSIPRSQHAAAATSRAVTRLTGETIARARSMNLSTDDAHRVFLILTQNGPSLETDQYFEQVLRPTLYAQASGQLLDELQSYAMEVEGRTRPGPTTYIASDGTEITTPGLNHDIPMPPGHHRRIAGGKIRAAIAKEVLAREITLSPPDRDVSTRLRRTVNRLLAGIHEMTDAGTARDELIESLAWSLDIRDKDILARLESEKSTNWHFVNPSQIRKGSALTQVAGALTPSARHDAIEYFMNPQGPLPASVVDAVHNAVKRDSRHRAEDFSSLTALQREVGDAIRQIETAAHSASAYERIPVLMLLMRSGENAPMHSPDYPQNILRQYLGFRADPSDPRGSKQERTMRAYLRTIGPDEVSANLAGMMALHHESDGQRWRPMFEIFTGVGVKGGQLTSVFNLLGPEATAELRGLRDRARPLSKYQVERIFENTLTFSERSRIRRTVRVLGSASMKTVVLVELVDGRQVVAMVRAPNVQEQNRSNIERAKLFVANLREEGIEVPSFMDDIIRGTERQMQHEENFTEEVENVLRAQGMYDKLNTQMANELEGWHFHVPGPIEGFTPRDNLIFMEYAPGIPHENITNDHTRKHTGRMLLRAGVRGLFRHRILNTDPHGGNYLIDENTRTIHPIDFGQEEVYRRASFIRSIFGRLQTGDDIYNLSQFLRAVEAQNVDDMVRFGVRLSATGQARDHAALREELRNLLRRAQSNDERLIGITDAFSRHEVPMEHRFSFGVLKALLIYQRENFAGVDDLHQVLTEEVTRVLRTRPMAVLQDSPGEVMQTIRDCVVQSLHGP